MRFLRPAVSRGYAFAKETLLELPGYPLGVLAIILG